LFSEDRNVTTTPSRLTSSALATLGLLLLHSTTALAAPSAAEVLQRSDKAGHAETSHTIIEQTIQTTRGSPRTFTIEAWTSAGGERSIMRFLAPGPSRGIGMLGLDHGDNIWAYFPDSDDLRKIASSARNASMEGSDFSYEDMTLGAMGRRYEAKSVTEDELDGKACYRLELRPKKSSPYSRIVTWVDRTTYIAYRSHFFNKKDVQVKTLSLSGWSQIQGVWTPELMVMENLKRGSKTSIKMVETQYNQAVDEGLFTTEFLTTF
jgi:outer membrane lipoprotein-sorting protein